MGGGAHRACNIVLQQNLIKKAATTQGAAAAAGMEAKDRTHEGKIDPARAIFLPLACETFGGWAPEALDFFKELSRRLAAKTHDPVSEVHPQFMQRLSMAIGRGVARCMLRRLASNLEDDVACY